MICIESIIPIKELAFRKAGGILTNKASGEAASRSFSAC